MHVILVYDTASERNAEGLQLLRRVVRGIAGAASASALRGLATYRPPLPRRASMRRPHWPYEGLATQPAGQSPAEPGQSALE